MVSKHFLIPAFLSALLVLGAGTDAFARGGGGGGGGGGHGGGGGGGGYGGGGRGGYGGGYGRGGFGGGYGGYGGFGYGGYGGFGYGGYGWGGGGGYGYPYYGDSYYGGGYYPYAYPYAAPAYAPPMASATPGTAPSTAYYYAPPPTAYAGNPTGPVRASIHVIVPDPQTTVFFDGHKTATTGIDRVYQTPPLERGGSYTYTLRASWTQGGQAITQEKTVTAVPGQIANVVFSRTSVASTAAASK